MQPSILQADPRANYLAHKPEIDEAISRVLESGRYILGRETEAFEKEFAAYLGAAYAVGVGNGTDALEIALRACGVGAGDGVITVSHTAVATVAAIECVGASPILVDINPVTFTMEPEHLEETLDKLSSSQSSVVRGKPKAVIPVHLYGHPADMPAILEISQRYGLYVIEDCAQSHGAALYGRKTGTWGHLAAFSFYPTKNLGTLGDGGMVATNDPELAEKVRLLREYGWKTRFISSFSGINSRLDELQAAILRVKLRHLEDENRKRQSLAKIYTHELSSSILALPECISEANHVYHQYVIKTEYRDLLKHYLNERGIYSLIHYPVPIHLQPAYQGRLPFVNPLANTEKISREVLSLPMYPELTQAQIHYVSEAIISWNNSFNH